MTYPDQFGANLGAGLVLRESDVREERRMADDARLGVAKEICLPLPRRSVRVARTDVLGLESLELLLRS